MNPTGALASRAMLFAGMEGLSLVVGFLMQPLLMRALGPAMYGSYALACALGVLAYTLTDFGFNYAGVKRAVELSRDASAAHRHFWAVQAVKACAGGAAVLLGAWWAAMADTPQARLIALAVAVGSAAAWCFPMWFLLGRQKVIWTSSSMLAARVICLGAVAWTVHGPSQLGWAVLLTLGAPLLATVLLLADREVRAQLRPCAPRREDLRDAAMAGVSMLWLSGHGVASAAVAQSLLMSTTNSSTVGLFAAADRVRAGLQGLFAAFGVAVFPRFVQQQVEGDVGGQARVWSLLRLQLAAALLLGLPVFIWAPEIVRFVLGVQFGDSAPVLRVLVVALLGTTALAGLGVQVMLPRGQGLQYTLATLGVLGLQCAGVLLLAPRLGASGAAWALVLSEGFVALVLLVALTRRGSK